MPQARRARDQARQHRVALHGDGWMSPLARPPSLLLFGTSEDRTLLRLFGGLCSLPFPGPAHGPGEISGFDPSRNAHAGSVTGDKVFSSVRVDIPSCCSKMSSSSQNPIAFGSPFTESEEAASRKTPEERRGEATPIDRFPSTGTAAPSPAFRDRAQREAPFQPSLAIATVGA